MVTSLAAQSFPAEELYAKIYCARGDMENRIKEQQLDLFADRTSSHTMRANQLRLSSIAYVLMAELRRLGLAQQQASRTSHLRRGARAHPRASPVPGLSPTPQPYSLGAPVRPQTASRGPLPPQLGPSQAPAPLHPLRPAPSSGQASATAVHDPS